MPTSSITLCTESLGLHECLLRLVRSVCPIWFESPTYYQQEAVTSTNNNAVSLHSVGLITCLVYPSGPAAFALKRRGLHKVPVPLCRASRRFA
jgi:hypothetical protein